MIESDLYRRGLCPLVFLLLAAAILAGCQPKKSILLEDTLCQYPCWQNIQPGVSSSEDALNILRGATFLAATSSAIPRKVDDVRSYSSWGFIDGLSETSGRITYFDNTVAYIEFDVLGNLRIKEMIAYYGEPELISVITGWGDSRWLMVYWIYPDKGVLITHFDHSWRPSGEYARITPELPVDRVYYFDPALYDTLVKTVFFESTDQEVVQKSIQPWGDFGLVPFVEE